MDSGELPTTMFHEGNEITDEDLPDVFADLFKSKVDGLVINCLLQQFQSEM